MKIITLLSLALFIAGCGTSSLFQTKLPDPAPDLRTESDRTSAALIARETPTTSPVFQLTQVNSANLGLPAKPVLPSSAPAEKRAGEIADCVRSVSKDAAERREDLSKINSFLAENAGKRLDDGWNINWTNWLLLGGGVIWLVVTIGGSAALQATPLGIVARLVHGFFGTSTLAVSAILGNRAAAEKLHTKFDGFTGKPNS